MKQTIVSGMRPTGKLHLGHYLGVIQNWVELQDKYDCYFFAADWHALTTKYDKTDELRQNTLDVVMDWLACGIDPNKSTIYVQSLVPEIAELNIYLGMITPQNWVERDPTLKDMAKILKTKEGQNSQINFGLMGYPVLMSSDIMMFNADCVPVGIDQVAHIEITRDIARRFNNLYGEFFHEAKPLLNNCSLICGLDGNKMGKSFNNDIKISDDIARRFNNLYGEFFHEAKPLLNNCSLICGLDGNKMGKSFNNDIKISDDAETTSKKVMTAITDRSKPLLNNCSLICGLDGNKMGKSFNNDIKISDDAETTSKKVMTAITDRSRLRKDDLGHPEECEVAFKYWKIFGSEEEIATIRCECEKGLRGCAQCKRQLGEKINAKLAAIREKRKYYEEHPQEVEQIIKDGSAKARVKAQEILKQVRELVKMY